MFVYVFYGDGEDFNSTIPRYQNSLHNWGNIVDYDNSYEIMDSVLAYLGTVITTDDNLLIYWVVGHGGFATAVDDPNDYGAYIENRHYPIFKEYLIPMFDQISNYRKRKILWMTCKSGSVAVGDLNFMNDRTVIITSSYWDEDSFGFLDYNNECHTTFNFALNSLLSKKHPDGTACNVVHATQNIVLDKDSVLSLKELKSAIYYFTYKVNGQYLIKSYGSYPLINPIRPILTDSGIIASKTFVNEKLSIGNLKLADYESKYWIDKMNLFNISIEDSSSIEVDIDVRCLIEGPFYLDRGSYIDIKP